jgi:FkbM family methyltransferase
MKEYIREVLDNAGLYHRMKGSRLYELYWKAADPRVIDDVYKEAAFYRRLLTGFQEGDLIFDVGANQGYKTGIFFRLGAKVVAVEPDDLNQEVLRQKFLTYRMKKKPLVIVPKAVSDKKSIVKMWIDEPGSAKNTLSQKWAETLREDKGRFGETLKFEHSKEIETVTIEDLIAEYGVPYFLKIDVEGHEPSILRGMRQTVPFLSFEVNLPEFREEGLECVRTLSQLCSDGKFNYAVDCLGGFALGDWIGSQEFLNVLGRCSDSSIEVFWKSPARSQNSRRPQN